MRNIDDGEIKNEKRKEKRMDKTWSSVSNSSLVRPWFQSKTNMHFKKIFVPENISSKKNLRFKKFRVQKIKGSDKFLV